MHLAPTSRRLAENELRPTRQVAATRSSARRPRQQGLTLLEMMLVITIIGAILGMALPIYNLMVASSKRSRTLSMIDAIATAMATYRTRVINWPNGQALRMWDVDADGVIDGEPASLAGTFQAQAITAGYRGFLVTTGLAVETGDRSTDGCPLDAWKRKLRIRFASGADDLRYGASGIGIWSYGEPGPASGNPDLPLKPSAAITSWRGQP
jgi:prepilin-type N-terminal cleavage/methylation domain-containing protein